MAHAVIMPKQGLQMTEGFITQWLKREGEAVRQGEPLFEMETDKLSITIDAPHTGTLLKILHEAGESVPVARTIAYIGTSGERVDINAAPAPAGSEESLDAPAAMAPEPDPGTPAIAPRMLATPRAKTTAEAQGVSLEGIRGTGPDGLIIARDVPAAPVKASPPADAPVPGGEEPRQTPREAARPMGGIRRSIAEKMLRSQREHAQASHEVQVDMGECLHLKERLAKAGIKASINDFVLLCAARALREQPFLNCTRSGNSITRHERVHLGIAVDTERGLMVPVVRNADTLGIRGLGEAARDLTQRARGSTVTPEELSGSTFTVSNLGMTGIDRFTAILNTPECGILAVGAVKKQPAATEDGQLVVRDLMWLTLTYDHCAIDGAPAARFLYRVKQLLETPALMM